MSGRFYVPLDEIRFEHYDGYLLARDIREPIDLLQ